MIKPLDIKMMEQAISLSRRALEKGEFPVGCLIALKGEVVGEGFRMGTDPNRSNELDHAEILAIRNIYERFGVWPGSLGPLTCYSTMEPCLMCLGALLINGVKRIVFGYEDVMGGACGINLEKRITWKVYEESNNNKEPPGPGYIYRASDVEFVGGVLRERCLELFKAFFSRPESQYLDGTPLKDYTLSAQ